MNITDITLLHCSLIHGIGPGTIQKLGAALNWLHLDQIYAYTVQDFIQRCDVSAHIAQLLVRGLQDREILDKELDLLQRVQISWISFLNTHYPALLQKIHIPPIGLYVKGAMPVQAEKYIAFVGSRQANSYARRCIEMLVPPLIEAGWTIVSGGALGADTMAHDCAVRHGGKTIVVLGSGLLKPYPAQNNDLFARVLKQDGALISTFPLMMQASAGNFPARNRIISGLSQGCVVIQAAYKSGAGITAECALEQGREVFAVPGSIEDPLSAGCHALIGLGATLVTSVTDILQQFGQEFAGPVIHKSRQSSSKEDSIEDLIIAYCHEPASIDDIAQKFGIGLSVAQEVVLGLQFDGRVDQNMAGLWFCS